MLQRLKMFIRQCKRVLIVSSKPDRDEIKLSSKITSIGIAIIGLIGFIIFMIFRLLNI
ncbi:MAG: protein translocase SEC61 complex subunit gamma [Candidatus Aenigmarchaeota archaeon]|nr:protein translocase SEC61 complex subunit gamma [Candidatus Aenigmarchaeota archaeon]